MANLSDRTRKNQVFNHLHDRLGEWVDGPEISNEKVGGSEGLRRLRELQQDGFRIEHRRHPNTGRDIWQYRLVLDPAVRPIRESARNEPTSSLKEAVQKGIDGDYHYVEPEPKLRPEVGEPAAADFAEGDKYTRDPGKLEIGVNVPCPRCKLRGTMSPHTKFPCSRCNGWGIVPSYRVTMPSQPNTGPSGPGLASRTATTEPPSS